jgi:hypothetical protein
MLSKKLTNNTWLLTSDLGHHVSLVWKREDSFISSHNPKKLYKNLEEISTEFAEQLTEKVVDKDEATSMVLDYPTKHDVAYEISGSPYPTYKTKENSNVIFAAGYWILHFNGTYRLAISPKISTLDELCQGPYRDKFTANVNLTTINKRKATEEIISNYTSEQNDD